ncbi:MAG: FAD-binding oxidoreductase [Chloroflexi bacterium]|nr:FAD-binding oxidoreductase [Chloroflexota bacterium]
MGRIIPGGGGPLPATADVVVIGGGIAGAADAFFLGHHGLSAVVLERASQLGSLTTAQAVACYRAQWDDAHYAALTLPSIAFYEAFEAETGLGGWQIGLRQQGWLFLTAAPDGPAAFGRFVEATRSFGVLDSELLVGDEIRRRFPWVAERMTAATFRTRDGWVSPYEVVQGLARASTAEFFPGTEALEILVDGGRATGVRTSGGAIATPRVVVSAGPFSRRLAATAGIDLPVTMIRHHRAMVAPQPEIPALGPMTLDVDTHAYWRPEGGGAFLGMGQDEDGTEPVDPVPTDWTFPAVVMDAASRAVPFWSTIADRLTGPEVSLAAGQYTCTADGRPLIGGCEIEGLYFHTGDNGWGIESGPEAGRRLAAIVAGAEPDDATNPYRLRRPTAAAGAPRTVTY